MRYQVRLHPTLDVLVSSIGEVFVDSPNHKPHWTFGRADSHGYLQVGINGKLYQVHRLVAQTFLPNPGNKPEVDHLNRNPKDNRAFENLRWATHSDNMRNTIQHDRVSARGEKHYYDYKDKKQYMKEWGKTHKNVRFSDGKCRWLPNSEAILLLDIPVKDRHYGK